MKLASFILLLAMSGAALAGGEPRSSSLSVERSAAAVSASGRWVANAKPDIPLLATVNTARIECRKDTMTCTEAVAVLLTSEDDPLRTDQSLMVSLKEYKISSWADTKIVAKSEGKFADLTLEIDVARRAATRRYQEASGSAPYGVTWQLR